MTYFLFRYTSAISISWHYIFLGHLLQSLFYHNLYYRVHTSICLNSCFNLSTMIMFYIWFSSPGVYLCVVMTMTSLSVIFAVLVTNLHSRGSKLRRAPQWLSRMCVVHIAPLLFVSQDIPLLASTIQLVST